MEVVKTIISGSNMLLGFVIRGTQQEWDQLGWFNVAGGNIVGDPQGIEIPMTITDMARIGYNDGKISVGTSIEELGDFRMHDLPMLLMLGKDRGAVEIANDITLVSRVINGDELAGFGVKMRGEFFKYTYKDLIMVARWFKPTNFLVRRGGKGGRGVVSGLPGSSIMDLPEEQIGKPKKAVEKMKVKGIKDRLNVGDNHRHDLLSLYKLVEKNDGIVVRLPDEKYRSITKPTTRVASGFQDLRIGEIGSPRIKFSEKKLTANTTFRKVGVAMVTAENAMPSPVYTYIFSTKSIFVNLESNMKRFAIGVNEEGAARLQEEFGDTIGMEPLNDRRFGDPIRQLSGKPDLQFFVVDTSKLSVINTETAIGHIQSNLNIRNMMVKLMSAKAHNKYCNGKLSDIRREAADAGEILVENEKPFGLYAGLKPQYLQSIADAGINILTGAFERREAIEEKDGEEGRGKPKEALAVEIEYEVSGTSIGRLPYRDMLRRVRHPMLDGNLLKLMDTIDGIEGLKGKYDALVKYKMGLDREIYKIQRLLWLHKMAMAYTGEGKLHTHDKHMWKEVNSRGKKNKYVCLEEGCEDLILKVGGMTI